MSRFGDKVYKHAIIGMVCTAFFVSLFATLSVKSPIGSDFYWHLSIAKYYAVGNFGSGVQVALNGIQFPYGFYISIFHLLLVPLVWSENPYFYGLILQVLLMPLTYGLTLFLMVKKAGLKSAFITGMLLLSSIAFVDGSMQIRPESLDLLLYPLMLFAVLSVKKKSFVSLALITVYSHGIAALSNIYGLCFKLLQNKEWRKTLAIGFIALLPILAVSLYYLKGAFQEWFTLSGPNNSNPQQTLFWSQPLTFIPVYSGLSLIGFIFLFKRNKSSFESLLAWGLIGSAVMIPFWADRWLQYITIPLSCLVGLGLRDVSSRKLLVVYPLLFMVLCAYVFYWVWVSLSGSWWQPSFPI